MKQTKKITIMSLCSTPDSSVSVVAVWLALIRGCLWPILHLSRTTHYLCNLSSVRDVWRLLMSTESSRGLCSPVVIKPTIRFAVGSSRMTRLQVSFMHFHRLILTYCSSVGVVLKVLAAGSGTFLRGGGLGRWLVLIKESRLKSLGLLQAQS